MVARTRVPGDPTMCERCGAVYSHATWRGAQRSQDTALIGVGWTLCPACVQVEEQEYFGRVRITARLQPEEEREIQQRIWNVERRARHTQPQRRLVRLDRTRTGLEILTTSQKLAHRIGRELEKAFGGKARFVWTDREGMVDATWQPPSRKPPIAAARPRRPRIKRRTLERKASRSA